MEHMNNPSDIQAVGNEVAAVLLQRLAQAQHATDDPEGRNLSVRVARLEANVESMLVTLRDFREDFRDYKKSTDEKFERIDERFGRIDERFERVLETQQRDFRLTWGAMIFGFIGLAGIMAKGFHWL